MHTLATQDILKEPTNAKQNDQVVKTVRGVSVSRYSCSEKNKIFIATKQGLGKYPRKCQTKTIMRK